MKNSYCTARTLFVTALVILIVTVSSSAMGGVYSVPEGSTVTASFLSKNTVKISWTGLQVVRVRQYYDYWENGIFKGQTLKHTPWGNSVTLDLRKGVDFILFDAQEDVPLLFPELFLVDHPPLTLKRVKMECDSMGCRLQVVR